MTKNSYPVTLNENGRMTIPASVRHALGFKPGDTLVLKVEDGQVRLTTYQQTLKAIQQELKHLVPPGSTIASDGLIAERRDEVRHEEESRST